MTDLNTGSVDAGTPSDVGSSTTTQANVQTSANVASGIDPHIAALQQPITNINKDAWYTSLENPDLRGYAETRNWKSPESVVESYQNLEKLMGADKAGRGLIMPADAEDAEGWNQLYNKLGRPEKADDYKLNVPEGFDGSMTKEASKWMHELGLNAKQAQQLNDKYNNYLSETMQAADAKYQQDQQAQVQEIMSSWGRDADKNIELTRRGVLASGLDENTLAQMDRAIGAKNVYEMFRRIGASYLEDSFEGNKDSGHSFGHSPEAARAEIQRLKSDKEFGAKLLNGDAATRQKWDNLNMIAAKR